MGAFTYIETDTGTNVDISAATAVGAYTSTGDKLIMVDVSIDAVAGNGDYVMYVTRQIGGSGSAYRILPQTTMAAASGLTAISAQSGWITVRNGDVLTCYVDGLAGDTSTPDWSTRWFELAGVTAAAVADSVWEEAIADHTTSTTFGGKNQKVVPSETVGDYKADVSALTNVTLAATQTGVTIPTVTTLTNLPAAPTDWLTAAAVKADAVTKIQNGLALEATLTAIKGAGWTNETLAAIDVLIDAIKAKTDVIPASPAAAGEYTTAIAAIPTTPLLAANYTAPDNAGIAAIQAKTDYLTFTTPNKVDASATVDTTGIATSAALAVVDANVDAIKVKTDALDNSAVTFVTAVNGTTITILRGDTFSGVLTNIGALMDYVSIDFTVKRGTGELDADAVLRIRKNASNTSEGLVWLNGATHATGTDGSITITDAPTGDVTIMLKANITDDLEPGAYVYDIQLIEAGKVSTLTSGVLNVTADVTRLVA